jgi:tetratricopeptide (TPR) repeat protein
VIGAGSASGTPARRRRLRLALALLWAGLAIGCPSDTRREEAHLERGRVAHVRGEHAAAVIEFRSALAIDPNRAKTHEALSESLLAQGRGAEAVWELRETVRLDPTNVEARRRVAWLMLAGQNPEEALEQAQEILERDPDHREAQLIEASAHRAQGALDLAAAKGEAILERWPQEKRAHYELAHVRARQGRLDDAERHLLRYRALDGGSALATRQLVRFYTATRQEAKAEEALRTALAEASGAERAPLALELDRILERGGRAAESEQPLRLALAAAPEHFEVRALLARLLARSGRIDQARALLNEAKSRAPQDPSPYRILGELLAQAGRHDDALVEFRGGLERAPDSSLLRLRESEALLRLGDLEASSQGITALLEQRPEDPTLAVAHAQRLALAERSDEAIEALRQVLARDPQRASAHYLLGVLLLQSDRAGDAVGSLEFAAVNLGAAVGREARRLLAEARLRSGEFETAAQDAAQLLAEDAGDQRARLIRAEALLASGASARAEALLREAPEGSAALHAALARVLQRGKRLDEAQAELERALELEPDSAQRVGDLARLLVERREEQRALALLRESMLDHPEVPEHPDLLGRILLRQGEPEEAQTAFDRAIEIDAGYVSAYVGLAGVAESAGRPAEARQVLRRGLAQRPGSAELLRALGALETRNAQPDAAIEAFEAALQAESGNPETQAALVRALADAGRDLDRALDLARSSRESDPRNPDFAEALGRVLQRRGLHAAAVVQFRDATALAPVPIAAYHYRLGLALLETGDREGAARELRRSLTLGTTFQGIEEARALVEELGDEGG